jgi:type I restriction enzyme S subunit
VTDGTHQSPKFVADGIPFLVIANVRNGSIDWSSVTKWVTENTYKHCTARCRPEKGDVLYTAVGSYGIALIVDTDREFMFQRHIAHVKPRHEAIAPEYLAMALNSPPLRRRADEVARGVAQKTVTLGELARYPIRLPPLNEQRRIVAKLESLQARSRRAREALDAVPPLLEKLRQSILAAAFRGDLTKDWRAKHPNPEPATEFLDRIRRERRKRWEDAELAKLKARNRAPTDDRWKNKYVPPEVIDPAGLPHLPTGWCWSTVEELTENFDGMRVPVKRDSRAKRQGQYPYYGASGVIDQVDDYLFDGSYLLIAEDGANLLSRSTPIAFEAHGKFWVNNHAHVVTCLLLPNAYLASYLNGIDLSPFVSGTAQPKLTQRNLERIPVALAPANEANKLIERIDRHLRVAEQLTMRAAQLRRTFRDLESSTLAKAFRGELVPQDPSDEPTEALLARLRSDETSPTLAKSKPRTRRTKAAE